MQNPAMQNPTIRSENLVYVNPKLRPSDSRLLTINIHQKDRELILESDRAPSKSEIRFQVTVLASPQVQEWLNEHASGAWELETSGDGYFFIFAEPRDAVAFRLRWS